MVQSAFVNKTDVTNFHVVYSLSGFRSHGHGMILDSKLITKNIVAGHGGTQNGSEKATLLMVPPLFHLTATTEIIS